jgi:hypothetical protein
MWRRTLWAVLGLGMLACAGNGSEDGEVAGNSSPNGPSGPNTPSGPVSQDQFADELAVAVCGNLQDCCTEAGFGYDRSTCETTLGQVYRGVLAQALASEEYDPALAGNCVRQVGDAAGTCNFDQFGGESCAGIFSASAARRDSGADCGQSCESTGSGTTCFIDGDNPGECYREDGLYCDTVTFTCAPLIPNGDACTTSQGCEVGYCSDGVCVARLAEGEYCGFEDRACRNTLICEFASNTCAPKAAEGGDCVFDDDCASDNCGEAGICLAEGEGDDTFLTIACGG